jgi:hypothetical protein
MSVYHALMSMKCFYVYLTSSIDDLGSECLTLVNDLVTKRVLYSRIVRLDKVAFAVLDRE